MKLFYINRHDSRCFSCGEGFNLAHFAAPAVMVGFPVLLVVLALFFQR